MLDFGGQYAHLIANRVRRLGVYSEILDGNTKADELTDYKGIILSGGPSSVKKEGSPQCDPAILNTGIPVLGLCYGHQLIALNLKGEVDKGQVREYGHAKARFLAHKGVFEGLQDEEDVWMSHFDQVVKAPEGFTVFASTKDCPIAAMGNEEKKIYSMQFHPEVTHTPCGMTILENFILLTRTKREWNIERYIADIMDEIREKAGDKNVFMLVSGGVDSTVAFTLLDKALGQDKVYGLFVDTGFMRMNEKQEVSEALRGAGIRNLHVYDAGDLYFEKLKEVYEPEEKRKIIGDLFLEIQAKVSAELNLNPDDWILGQGTIYPDTIETGGTKNADTIKTHHNRVPKIAELIEQGKVIEPLSQLYKDEVRLTGEMLYLDKKLISRHPFPGPGLAVRCLCANMEEEIPDKERIEKEINEITEKEGFKAVILPIKSVGVQGDERTYRHPVLLYGACESWDGLNSLSTQLTNQYPEINRVLLGLEPYEITGLSIQKSYLTKERILTTQKADKIVMDYIMEAKIDNDIWQFPTVLIPVCLNSQSGESIVLRPVQSEEAMTANFYQMDLLMLNELVKRLKSLHLFSGIFYDLTNKPPGTIEWE